jgi:hypothetical protein
MRSVDQRHKADVAHELLLAIQTVPSEQQSVRSLGFNGRVEPARRHEILFYCNEDGFLHDYCLQC